MRHKLRVSGCCSVAEDLLSCRIHHPRLNDAAQLVLSAVKELGVRPLDEATGQGDLRYVQLTALHSSCLQSPVGPTAQLRAEADPAAVVQVSSTYAESRC